MKICRGEDAPERGEWVRGNKSIKDEAVGGLVGLKFVQPMTVTQQGPGASDGNRVNDKEEHVSNSYVA